MQEIEIVDLGKKAEDITGGCCASDIWFLTP